MYSLFSFRPRYSLVAGLVLILSPILSRSQSLPPVQGKYAVGVNSYFIQDDSRADSSLLQSRILPVSVWYPCQPAKDAKLAAYVPQSLKKSVLELGYSHQDSLTLATLVQLSTHSYTAQKPVRSTRFPLLVFSPGAGMATFSYTSLFEKLVSRGCIVVAISHPYYSGPVALQDGKLIDPNNNPYANDKAFAADAVKDIEFIAQQFLDPKTGAGKFLSASVDKSRIGALGHSIGGLAAFEASKRNSGFRFAINMDGGDFDDFSTDPLKVNSLIIRSSPSYTDEELIKKGRTHAAWDAMGRHIDSVAASNLERTTAKTFEIKVLKTGHMSFSDAPYLMPDMLTRFGGTYLNPDKNLETITELVWDFILSHDSENLLNKFSRSKSKRQDLRMKIYNSAKQGFKPANNRTL